VQVKKQGPFKMFLFNMALHYKQFWMRLGFSTYAASPLCNKIFFSKTQVRRAVGRDMLIDGDGVC
jgi:hypothetical protein